MWSSTPSCVPNEWRRKGAEELADAIGYGTKLGPGPRASSTYRDAFIWYDGDDEVKRSLSFPVAHQNACELAALIRASGVAGGKLDALESDTPLIVGLVLKRTAALPLAQLASFKAGATFVPLDPTWPVDRTVSILCEAGATTVLADSGNAEALAVSRRICKNLKFRPNGPRQISRLPHSSLTTRAPRCPPRSQTHLLGASSPCDSVVLLDERCAVSDVLLSKRISGPKLFPLRDEAKKRMAAATQERRCWEPPEVMYIMYTSGSTGKPKGCIVPTSGVWHRFGWGTKLLGFDQTDGENLARGLVTLRAPSSKALLGWALPPHCEALPRLLTASPSCLLPLWFGLRLPASLI